jgi:hypothetical protein
MLQNGLLVTLDVLEESEWRRRGARQWAMREALRLYERARTQAMLRRLWSALTGQRSTPYDLDDLDLGQARPGYQCPGVRSVPLRQICGSAGRCRDFDSRFAPRLGHCRQRWLSVAMAWLTGVPLPAVRLVQVGDIHFLRDGHHRVSVARSLGQQQIDAQVTVWRVTGPLPWEQSATTAIEQPIRGVPVQHSPAV